MKGPWTFGEVSSAPLTRVLNGVHLRPEIRLKSGAYIESIMPEISRAMNRERAPKASAAEMDRTIVSCLLGNLIAAGDLPVIISMHHGTKYPGLSQKQTTRIIDAMDSLGWIEIAKGEWRGDASTISRGNIDLSGLEISRGAEVIVRKGGKAHDPSVYFSEDEIARMKAELRELNEFYAASEITCRGEEMTSRSVRRIFNVEEGMDEEAAKDGYIGFGRLYGASWIGMKSTERGNIRIDDSPVAYLDFSSMNVHLAYYLSGGTPPSGDLYDLGDLLCGYEDTPEWRRPVKKFMSACWFCRSRRMPDGVVFPKKFSFEDVWTAISRRHPRLRSVLARRMVGYQMARLESDIMVDVLLRLRDRGIVGLPIHDGLLVPQSRIFETKATMDSVTQQRLGFKIPIKTTLLKPSTPDNYLNEVIDLSGGDDSTSEMRLR